MDIQTSIANNFPESLNVPQVSQPTHQYFGSQSQDPSPSLPTFGFTEDFDDFQFDDFGQNGSNDGKRRRIAKACDMCRKKKIKCDGGMPACKNCINYKTECAFTHVEKKRSPPKGAKYIEGLENRLARMEKLLRNSGLLDSEEGEEPDLATLERKVADRQGDGENSDLKAPAKSDNSQALSASPRSASHTENPSPNSRAKSPESEVPEGVEEISDQMCTLLSNTDGDTRYVGSSSGFSIFSPKGIEWVNNKTGDTSFEEMINRASDHDIKWAYWKPEIFGDLFARRTFQPLPPQDEAHSLLRDFFENFNCMFPLFHEPTFMLLVDRQYSRQPYEGSGWWASLNCALAIAHRLRVMSNLVPQDEDRKGWGYLKNAMGVLTELTMRNTDLLSVQALLGMALFLLGTPNPQPSYFLVAAAFRLANTIGLHKRGSGFNLNPMEIEQRSRVFWIAYLLDKDLCLRSGRPPAQDDDDMNVDLPSKDPADNVGNVPLSDGKSKVNLFRIMVEFSILQGKVYKQLYSTKASRQTDGVLLNTIGELDKELEAWKDRIPIELRPEHEIQASHPPLVLHVAVLHFAYYNCLTTIHRMSIHHGYWTNRLSSYALQGLNTRAINPRVFSSAALCVTAARASIQLIKYIPQGDFACVWLILYYPVSALVTLFANILQNPQDSRARSDVKLMNQVVNFLSLLSLTEEQGGVKRMLSISAEFERIAKCVLEKSDKSTRHKRKNSSKATPTAPPKTAAPGSRRPSQNAENLTNLTPNAANQPQSATISPNFNSPVPSVSPNPQNLSPASTYSTHYSHGSSVADLTSPIINHQPSNSVDQPSLNPEAGGPTPEDHIYPPSLSHFPTDNPTSPLNMGAFQQPFVPPDMWNMNMSLEWDWDVEGLGGAQTQYDGGEDDEGARERQAAGGC